MVNEMMIEETLYITERDEWRTWLRKNGKSKKEIWLIYYKKHSGKPRIPYDDAVEEALCFGWIDSTIKRIDEDRYCQKFTPRNIKSVWSELNIKRARKMIKAGRMTDNGLALFKARNKRAGKSGRPDSAELLEIPAELYKELAKNKKARDNFNNFAPGYRRMYIGWILSAKRDETREKRIKFVVERSEKNIKPGML